MSRKRTIKPLMAVLLLCASAGAALAGADDQGPTSEKALRDSCRSYIAAPASAAGAACAAALDARSQNVVVYGPDAPSR